VVHGRRERVRAIRAHLRRGRACRAQGLSSPRGL
jgi:hypothetical protein